MLSTCDIGAVRAGNTGCEGVWQFDTGLDGPTVMITSLIHGNEICGAIAIKELIEKLRVGPQSFLGSTPPLLLRGRLLLAFCNLKAFDQFDPKNLHASRFVDEDMNRVWSKDRLDLSRSQSYETARANQLLPWVTRADVLLDLHSMHDVGDPLLLTGLNQADIAFARSLEAVGPPVGHIVADAGHSDGIRLRDFQSQTTALLVECGFHLDQSSVVVARQSIYQVLVATKLCAATAALTEWAKCAERVEYKQVQVTNAVVAASIQMQFASDWHNMQTIEKAGTLIAIDGAIEHRTAYDHCTLIMPSLKQLKPGVTVARLAQPLL